jgi:hypothetical protein
MTPRFARPRRPAHFLALLLIALGACGECLAADPGRLFYTPAQRAQLEAARAGSVTRADQTPESAPPLRFDGIIIRSDGRSTSWVNGQARTSASSVEGLKPGQIRADGRVYEPYQVLRIAPNPAMVEGATQ